MDKIVHQINTKKISINELRTGMVLAKDIFDQRGHILLAKNTLVTELNQKKLMEKEVTQVHIKVATINVMKHEADNNSPQDSSPRDSSSNHIGDTPEFKGFANEYQEKLVETKTAITDISEGEDINVKDLYNITSSIMDKLTTRSDVLTYISFLKEYDEYTFSHSSNVSMLCNLFASWLKMDQQQTVNLTTAGLLHDIGKMKMPLEILNKKGRLTNEEYEIIKTHTLVGYRLIQEQNIPEDMKMATLMHHERIDGSGYPMGFRDKQINEYAKIIAICDIYDAMVSNRVYRGRICPFEVIKQFEQSSLGHLDTQYLLIFLKNIAYTYFGSKVILSNGLEGEVIYIHPNNLSRPVVRVKNDVIDTQKNLDVTVIDVI